MKQEIFDNLKNIVGWKTKRKLVVFVVDDYGNIRLHSAGAGEKIFSTNPQRIPNRFDAFDALETKEDLDALYTTFCSVKDQHGNPACFSPFALPANIDFEAVAADNYQNYHHELLPVTYDKLTALDPKAYTGTWELWKEGISRGLMHPQFHGREHLNLKVFEDKLAASDPSILTSLANRSYTFISEVEQEGLSYTAAFSFSQLEEIKRFPKILTEGLDFFEQVYGYRSTVFTPPARHFHVSLEKVLWENGIKALDKAFFGKYHEGNGSYRREFNTTKYNPVIDKAYLVRNVVFEPTEERGIDWVSYTFAQIEAAFRWNRPAIVSSHRVNFSGHIDARNRRLGLSRLEALLKKIIARWPEVEFISVRELTELILKKSDKNAL